ncbi:MAG: hypothetical protein U7123_17260 [Potamolinea sp.]
MLLNPIYSKCDRPYFFIDRRSRFFINRRSLMAECYGIDCNTLFFTKQAEWILLAMLALFVCALS